MSDDSVAVADDPVRFAEWVCRYCVGDDGKDEEDFAPPADQRERLQITPEQCAGLVRESVIMHAVGACMFVGRNLPVAYYSTFKREICAATAQRIHGVPTESRIQEVVSAVDQYIEHISDWSSESGTGISFGMTLLDRAMPDYPFHLELLPVAIQSAGLAVAVFTFVREGYCQLKHGLSFDAIQGLDAASELSPTAKR